MWLVVTFCIKCVYLCTSWPYVLRLFEAGPVAFFFLFFVSYIYIWNPMCYNVCVSVSRTFLILTCFLISNEPH
jgi:hypothetical protein